MEAKNGSVLKTQADLLAAIAAVRAQDSLTDEQKTAKIQELTRSFLSADPTPQPKPACSSSSSTDMSDREPTYHDAEKKQFGCQHYKRNFRIRAPCCGKFVACRMCHDAETDHVMDRYAVREMFCLVCKTAQPIGPKCITPGCENKADYYCDVCKYINNDPSMLCYHCADCGLCRVGRGLDQDFFHCKTCNVCMSIELKGKHKCVERSLESDCPVCQEYMFTSVREAQVLRCGHAMHRDCLESYLQHGNYTCPLCCKSMSNATPLFNAIDAYMAEQVMPDEYKHWRSQCLCNDCLEKFKAPYHMLYHKCHHCGSYNTKVMEVERRTTPGSPLPVFQGTRPQPEDDDYIGLLEGDDIEDVEDDYEGEEDDEEYDEEEDAEDDEEEQKADEQKDEEKTEAEAKHDEQEDEEEEEEEVDPHDLGTPAEYGAAGHHHAVPERAAERLGAERHGNEQRQSRQQQPQDGSSSSSTQ